MCVCLCLRMCVCVQYVCVFASAHVCQCTCGMHVSVCQYVHGCVCVSAGVCVSTRDSMILKYLCHTIDNIRHYGYETNKRHLNQAGFAPPSKFVNIFG